MPLPSVLLHDHLDGGLRVGTVIDLAAASGYEGLPTEDPTELANWFDQSQSGSLERYLEAFTHTTAVMQDFDAIERVAFECGEDLAADGVVYAEIRFCPLLHVKNGLAPTEVIEAVSAGMRLSSEATGMRWGLIIDSLRHLHDAFDMAELAVATRKLGVVGFDLAGPERGYPPKDHIAGLRRAIDGGLGLTIHAGESAGSVGVEYMASAVTRCGAERIGHGIEIVNDCEIRDGEIVGFGAVARQILDRQIPLEVSPASNMATGGMSASEHPLGLLYRAGFNVTINTDNRLMSDTGMSKEFEFARIHHGFTNDDLGRVTAAALRASFSTYSDKLTVWESIAPAYEFGPDIRSVGV